MRIDCSGEGERRLAPRVAVGRTKVVVNEHRRRLHSSGTGGTMHRRIMVAVLALIIWSGTIGGAAFAGQSPTAVAAPSVEQRLVPKVARLAQELGVTLDSSCL